MARTHECDRRDCPAPALRHVELYGQDFHFCDHHWRELPALPPPGSGRGVGASEFVRTSRTDPALASTVPRDGRS